MRAILIDSKSKTVEDIEIYDIYQIEDIIGTSDIDAVYEWPNGDLLYAESRVMEEDFGEDMTDDYLFYAPYLDFPIPGKAVITGPAHGEIHYEPTFSPKDIEDRKIFWIKSLDIG
jgi:hypothetical protein